MGKKILQTLIEIVLVLIAVPVIWTIIAEIALMLGYSNSSNFFRAFREYYKMSPREYVQTAM